MKTLQDRTKHAIDAGFTIGELADAAQKTSQAASHWLSGKTKSLKGDSASGLEALTGWSASWWVSGKTDPGPSKRASPKQPDRMNRPLVTGVDHPKPLDAPTVPPKLSWEYVMAAEPLQHRFTLLMPDDALAPFTPAGMPLVFETGLQPKHGAGVLVQSADGRRYVRRYAEGLHGEWEAQARNDAFVTLKSKRDGLALLAVVVMRIDTNV